jgi:hypothetical protein
MALAIEDSDGLDAIFDTGVFAETVSYTPTGGEAKNITVVVDRDFQNQEPYVRGMDTAMAMLACKKSEVSNPQINDIFTFDSQTWELDPERGVVYEDASIVEVVVRRVD